MGYNTAMKRSSGSNLGGWQERLITSSLISRSGFTGPASSGTAFPRLGLRFLSVIYVCLVAVVVARLVYLQIFERGQHTLLAATNHLERIRESAPRGILYDRHGEAIVANVSIDGTQYTREYLLGAAAAPITGYIAEVTEDEIGCTEGLCNEPGMWTGRTGAEKVFEQVLRGRDGGRLVEFNAQGHEVRELGTNKPEKGEDVYLSIDVRLQKIMSDALGAKTGSAVAVDMQGKVLGLVSSPTYDPNLFTVRPDSAKLRALLSDDLKQYFLNRPIAGVYPPGSVYKMVTAYAGLEDGKITADTLIEDTGEIRVNQYRYGNWFFDQYGQKEGQIDVERALGRSNDIFFYKVGEMVGVDTLVSYTRKFGFGQKTGLELPGEVAGLVPDRLWKERQTGEKWFLGNTYHMSIGQGDLQVTPAQVARETVAAVSGRLCDFSILRDTPVQCSDMSLRSENIAIVREGMKQVCASGGTAFPFFDFQPWVLCKTGTAQHAGQKTESDKPHAWITVAYPGENPEMILVVMLDSAGEGSYEAGPVAKYVLEKWRDLGE